jgi:type IV secretion system protein VirB3
MLRLSLVLWAALAVAAAPARAQTTNFDPQGSGPILNAVNWLQGTLLGNVATALAVIAVGATGLHDADRSDRLAPGRDRDPRLLHRVRRRSHRRWHPVRATGYRPMARLERDPVFGALTMPQMFAGVTYSYFVLNAVVTIELFLITKSFWALLAGPRPPRGRLSRLPEGARVLRPAGSVKVSRCPRVKNAAFWRCNSYSA